VRLVAAALDMTFECLVVAPSLTCFRFPLSPLAHSRLQRPGIKKPIILRLHFGLLLHSANGESLCQLNLALAARLFCRAAPVVNHLRQPSSIALKKALNFYFRGATESVLFSPRAHGAHLFNELKATYASLPPRLPLQSAQ
jgi:hypothetical protein